jgi:hypothetical protein
MGARPMRAARAIAAVAAAAAVSHASASEGHPWYVPDRAKVQLAGNIGFVSPGVGWAFAREHLEADLFFGWVPKAVGGEDIVSLSGKLTWLPWEFGLDPRWRVRPLTLGLQLTYTFGDEYFVDDPGFYGPDYYDFPTALHAGVALGGLVGRRGGGRIRELGVYWEVVALDTALFTWMRNPHVVGPADVFSLALGLRLSL